MLPGQGNHVERMGPFADDDRIPIVDIQAFLTSLVVEPGGEAQVEVKIRAAKVFELNRAFMEVTAEEICVSGLNGLG